MDIVARKENKKNKKITRTTPMIKIVTKRTRLNTMTRIITKRTKT